MPRQDKTRAPSTSKRMFWMLLVVALVFGAIFFVKWYGAKMTNQYFDSMPQPPATVSATAAREQSWSQGLEAVGTLDAVNGAEVTTESGGVIRAIHFTPGQAVKKGTVLVELNTANEQATLASLESAAKLAAVQRDRYRELAQQKLVARADVDERNTTAASAQAQVAAQRALIAQKTVRAPFDGILGIRKVNIGQFINPGDPIVSLQSLDPIFLNFTLPEQNLGNVKEGLRVHATLDALPGRTFEGRVTAIEPNVDPDTRNFAVQATLDNPDKLLRPGSFAHVAFDVGSAQKVIVVPQTAISFNPYGNSVYVIEKAPPPKAGEEPAQAPPGAPQQNGPQLVVQQRFIKTGATRGDLIAVTEGLKPGDRVATSGLLKLRNGAAVTINNKVQPDAEAHPDVKNR